MDKSLEDLTDIQKKIILLASTDNTPITGKLWLQQELFLLTKAIDEFGKEAKYGPHEFGPFSAPVDHSLDQLVKLEILSIDDGRIYLTSKGKHIAKCLESGEDPSAIKFIKIYKNFLNDFTRDELLCFAYSDQPEMAEKSKVYSEIKLKTESIVLDLVQKERISIGRASELMDKNISHVIKGLNKRGHQILY